MRSFGVLVFASFVAMSLQCGAGPKVASRPIASCPTPPPNVELCPAAKDASRAGCPGGPGGIGGKGGIPVPPTTVLTTYCTGTDIINPGCPGTPGGLMGPPMCRDGKLPVNNVCSPAPPTCPAIAPTPPALALAGCPHGFGGYDGLGGPGATPTCVPAGAGAPAAPGCVNGPGGMMGPGGPGGKPLAVP